MLTVGIVGSLISTAYIPNFAFSLVKQQQQFKNAEVI